jgi:O-antigen/teichoic acid export membrane protein
LVVLLNVVVKPLWLLMENAVQNEVGHEDWGTYSALLSFGFLFLIFSDLGINQYATKSLASRPEMLKAHFPDLFGIKLLVAFLYPFLMVFAGWLIGYGEAKLWFLLWISCIQGGMQIVLFFRANFQAAQRFKLDGVASVADRFVLLIFVGILLMTGIRIEEFIFARLAVTALMILVFYFVLVRLYGWIRPRLNIGEAKKLLRFSYPFAMVMILYSILDKVDQVMLERISGDTEAGLYAGAYRWMDAFSMYLWTVLPIFFARFALFLSDFEEQQKLLEFGQKIAAIPLIFASAFVFFYGEKLMFLFTNSTPDEIGVMTSCLKALFVAVFINAIFAIFSTLLTSTNHERFVNWMVGIGIVINIVLNFIFIPQYGAIASAWTTVATYIFMSITYTIYIHRSLPLRVPYGQMLKLGLSGGLLILLFFGLTQTAMVWYLNTLIAGVFFLFLNFALGLIPRDLVKKIR